MRDNYLFERICRELSPVRYVCLCGLEDYIMREPYKYPDLSSIEANPEFLRMQQLMDDRIKSIREADTKSIEEVCKVILNKLGYPNNIELHKYVNSNKTEFVNVKTNEILASVETINDGTVFYTETKYYGDWFR